MRVEFHKELELLHRTLAAQAQAAATAMRRASASLRDANVALAEQVIDTDTHIDLLERHVDEMSISLLARQAPVAGDLRAVVTALRLAGTMERMGDLARHVAYIARGRFPHTATEGSGYDLLIRMAEEATRIGAMMAELVESHDMDLAAKIEAQDEVLDDLHRATFEVVLNEDNPLSRQEIVDIVMLGRFLERYGDHAVGVARRMTFLVTGFLPEHESIPGTEEEVLGANRHE